MKVVIADDEYLVRSSLKSMLLELELPVEIVGEAANGEELVRLVECHNPDVAFVDIRMPRLNGLEAIKIAKNSSRDTQWVILTGFSEFDYAKESINLGASNYLLKPVSPEELKKVLDDLFIRTSEYVSFLNKNFENDLIALVNDLGAEPDESGSSFISQAKYQCALFIIDSSLNEKSKAELNLKFYKAIRSIISGLSTNDVRIALFPMPNGEMATVGAWGQKNSESAMSAVRKYFEEATASARQFNTDHFAITVLLSDECTSPEMLHKRFYQLENLSPLRSTACSNGKLTIEELVRLYRTGPSELIDLSGLLKKLSVAYKEKGYLNFVKSLEDIERILLGFKLINSDNKKAMTDFLLHAVNCRIDANAEPKAFIRALREHSEKLLAESRKEDSSLSDPVPQVIKFIDENYMYDISIGQIAEQLNITPNYLSSLFHKKMGTTFMKYLTKVRMLKAKELLSNHGLQVLQAAEKVGYYSTRHFTKLFKEYYGYYPSECRDK